MSAVPGAGRSAGWSTDPPPLLAQARMSAAGMRPIDAVVDATNYTMLELGQPLHGFDLARLAGPAHRRATRVRRRATYAPSTTSIATLTDADLLICDADASDRARGHDGRPAAEVPRDDGDVLLESATSRAAACSSARAGWTCIRRRRTGSSAAPTRRGSRRAAARCAQLMTAGRVDRSPGRHARRARTASRRWVSMRPARAAALLGYRRRAADAAAVFDTLGMMAPSAGSDAIEVEIPGYRTDIDHEVDLIEEIVRVQGYDRVGTKLPRAPHPGGAPRDRGVPGRVKDALVRAGLREIRPTPFVSPTTWRLFGDDDAVRDREPPARRRRVPADPAHAGACSTPSRATRRAASRRSRCSRSARRSVWPTRSREHRKLGFALAGPAGDRLVLAPSARVRRAGCHGRCSTAVLDDLGVESWQLGRSARAALPPGPIGVGRRSTGRTWDVVGEIHPRVAGLRRDRWPRRRLRARARPVARRSSRACSRSDDVPRFPPVRRDLAFVLPADAAAGRVARRC